jgi:peptidoglycan/xylan/chitin deacetylase (PgdA/CDA1 family)
MTGSLPILCYRNVSPVCGISPGELSMQLGWLKKNGWTGVTVDEAVDILSGKTEGPEKAVALTFDDSYLDNWVHAAPLLRAVGMKASFGVATAYLHDGACRPNSSTDGADLRGLPLARDAWSEAIWKGCPAGFMNRLELSLLVEEDGHALYGRTHTQQACFCPKGEKGGMEDDLHPGIGIWAEEEGQAPLETGSAYAHNGIWPVGNDLLDGRMAERTTQERIEFCLEEFTACRDRLEEITGKPPKVLGWPWGEWDGVCVEAAQLAGFQAGLSLEAGTNVPGNARMFALRRIRMQGGLDEKGFARLMKRAGSGFWARFL